jgi:hypothetical protein
VHGFKGVSVLSLCRLVSIRFSVPLFLVAFLGASIAFGQQLTGTVSGTIYDQAGAVVPNANITLTNQASGDTRQTVSNATGYFSFPAVPPGTYTLEVKASGFEAWQANGISISQGKSVTVPNIALSVGRTTETVEVSATAASVAPVDTGEVSHSLNEKMIDSVSYVGRNAGELMRIFPGAANNGGLGVGGFNDHSVSSNTGPVGSFSFNGAYPYGSMGYMLDGANLVDPGNAGTQIANVNPDMTAEIKVLTNSYDAEYAIGPVLFQAYSKSGGRDFHGEGYFYARNGQLDSVESSQKALAPYGTKPALPTDHYYYPGGNIGGPVLLPFTHFNHDRNKLFFWFGYEYMNQKPVGAIAYYDVPTQAMLNGDFSPQSLAAMTGSATPNSCVSTACGSWSSALTQPCTITGHSSTGSPNYNGSGCGGLGFGSSINNGVIPASLISSQGLAMLNLLPKPNVDPATHNGYNYEFTNPGPLGTFLIATNRWEQTEKIDFTPSDKDKLTVSYVYQKEQDLHPIATWWAPSSAVPYPSAMPAATPSSVIMGNYTHVFGPSVVNELVVTYARYVNDLSLANPSAVDPAKLGINTQGLFGRTQKQIPDTLSWSGSLAEFMPQADFYGGGNNVFGATKATPAVYDNISWVKGSHTMKFGGYFSVISNNQSIDPINNIPTQGQYEFETYGGNSSGNVLADELMGHAFNYAQASTGVFTIDEYRQISAYAQDSWKVGRHLTLNYGVRFDHIGQYYDPNSPGMWVWDPALYSNSPNAPANTGLVNNQSNPRIPRSGLISPWAYVLPRVGVAYDIFGNGKTVLRGGFAEFRYQMGTNVSSGSDDTGAFEYTTPSVLTLGNLAGISAPAGTSYNGSSFTAFPMNVNKIPATRDYNVTIDQSLPGRSLLEVAYVGTYNYDGLLYGGGNGLENPNAIPFGTFWKPDPINPANGSCSPATGCPSTFNSHDYVPYQNYQNIMLANYGSYSNYNGLQVTWQKQTGPVLFFTNYTFSKVLGIRDGFSGDGGGAGTIVDSLCVSCNYGTLAYDHRHILNFMYVWTLPSPVHSNVLAKGLINGWTLSGITTMQSGDPLQPNTGGNLNVVFPGSISNSSWLGTSDIILTPALTCDPTKGLTNGQRFNPSCFTIPAPGTEGSIVWPNITQPWSFNSDLSLYKSFKFSESRSLQFRADAFNFLNHPNPQFDVTGSNADVRLVFNSAGQNTNLTTNGKPQYTTGFRQLEFAAKFYF